MPELPEVETVVRAIRPKLINQTIIDYQNDWGNRIKSHIDAAGLRAQIVGQTVVDVRRRAKFIVVVLTHDFLVMHLRMSGHLSVVSAETPTNKYVHDTFTLDNGTELRFRDTRKFGTVALVSDENRVLGKLGFEPLSDDFTVAALRNIVSQRKRQMKPLLLDQSHVAGIGNIYADEALFEARIDPRRQANTLTDAEIERLYHAIRHVLQLGIDREGASISTYVKPDGKKGDMQNAVNVFRRTDAPCYLCSTPIQRIKLAQRSTHFCPICQK
ncbi:MAG: DNA-formamidopyrimidine glycosylase [Candidatus Promineifilaceae bacterium]